MFALLNNRRRPEDSLPKTLNCESCRKVVIPTEPSLKLFEPPHLIILHDGLRKSSHDISFIFE